MKKKIIGSVTKPIISIRVWKLVFSLNWLVGSYDNVDDLMKAFKGKTA